jgi:hypothetical protein
MCTRNPRRYASATSGKNLKSSNLEIGYRRKLLLQLLDRLDLRNAQIRLDHRIADHVRSEVTALPQRAIRRQVTRILDA